MAYVSNTRSLAETVPSKSAPSDVFISHCKHPLAGLISEKLEAMGVKVFGNSEELQLASLYFVIFSKEHAQSSRCLEELTLIRKRGKGSRIRIVPIFYQVKPEDVRYLKGAYRSAFDRYKTEGKHTSKKLHKWEKALFHVSHNIGPIVNNKEDEDMLLKKIPNWVVKEGKFLPVDVEGFSPSIYASGGSEMSVNDHSELKAFRVPINRRMEAERMFLADCLRVVRTINDFLDISARQIKEIINYLITMEGTVAFLEQIEEKEYYFPHKMRTEYLGTDEDVEYYLGIMEKAEDAYLGIMEKAEEAYLGIMKKEEETFLGIMEKDKEVIPAIIKNDREAFLVRMERIREALKADTVEKEKLRKHQIYDLFYHDSRECVLYDLYCNRIFDMEITVGVFLKALGSLTIDSLEMLTKRLENRLRKCDDEIMDFALKKLLKWKKTLHKVSRSEE